MTATVCFTLIPSCPQCLQCIKSILNATTHKCVPAPNKSRHQLAHLFNGALHLTWTVRQIAISFTHALYHPGEGISQRSTVLRFCFFYNAFPSYPWDKASYIIPLPPTQIKPLCVLVPLIASSILFPLSELLFIQRGSFTLPRKHHICISNFQPLSCNFLWKPIPYCTFHVWNRVWSKAAMRCSETVEHNPGVEPVPWWHHEELIRHIFSKRWNQQKQQGMDFSHLEIMHQTMIAVRKHCRGNFVFQTGPLVIQGMYSESRRWMV